MRTAVTRSQSTAVAETVDAGLLKKAEGPWGALTTSEKTALYRAVYPTTRAEHMAAQGANQMQVFGVVAGE